MPSLPLPQGEENVAKAASMIPQVSRAKQYHALSLTRPAPLRSLLLTAGAPLLIRSLLSSAAPQEKMEEVKNVVQDKAEGLVASLSGAVNEVRPISARQRCMPVLERAARHAAAHARKCARLPPAPELCRAAASLPRPNCRSAPHTPAQHAGKLGANGAEMSAKVDAAAKSALGGLFGSKTEEPPAQE
jgi:hypothetical protein